MAVDPSGRRAARFAKTVLDALWWLMLVLSAVFVLVLVAAPVLERSGFVPLFEWDSIRVDDGSGPPRVRLEVTVVGDGTTLPAVTSSDSSRAVNPILERQANTHLVFGTRRWDLLYVANATLLPFLAALRGVLLLRRFLADVLRADVFTTRNAGRLSTLGWLVIAIGVGAPMLERLRAWLILRLVHLDGAALSAAAPDGNSLWLVGILLLVIAAAWRHGAELQQEHDLTV